MQCAVNLGLILFGEQSCTHFFLRKHPVAWGKFTSLVFVWSAFFLFGSGLSRLGNLSNYLKNALAGVPPAGKVPRMGYADFEQNIRIGSKFNLHWTMVSR